jgi:hypothetical protein
MGYQFTPSPPEAGRSPRPHALGETPDHRAQVELIGPPDTTFKATLTVIHPGQDDALQTRIRTDLLDFLTVLIPAWDDRAAWLTRHWDVLQGQQRVVSQFRDLLITLRTGNAGAQIVLSVTWLPEDAA